MSEKVAIRYTDGPNPGTFFATIEPDQWPLPEELPVPAARGTYRKVRESQLDPNPSPHLMRGAEYRWEPDAAVEP